MKTSRGLGRFSLLMGVAAFAGALIASPANAQQITVGRPAAVAQPKPFRQLSASIHELRDSIVALSRAQLGVKYKRGAASPSKGFDCSGLVKYVMAQFGAELPRTSREQALVGKKIERDIASLKPGDLLTFGHGKRISHIGIYIGDGRYVHAPTPGSRVKVETLANTRASWWKGARRVFAFDDSQNPDSVLN
ncbi:MAG TPA: C40 family peptidase [Gemmatimonadaceae bacterium]|jgi:cell wall-associated NlpC family hydrolase